MALEQTELNKSFESIELIRSDNQSITLKNENVVVYESTYTKVNNDLLYQSADGIQGLSTSGNSNKYLRVKNDGTIIWDKVIASSVGDLSNLNIGTLRLDTNMIGISDDTDLLTLTSEKLTIAGDCQGTTFIGNVTGNCSGTAEGLSSTLAIGL